MECISEVNQGNFCNPAKLSQSTSHCSYLTNCLAFDLAQVIIGLLQWCVTTPAKLFDMAMSGLALASKFVSFLGVTLDKGCKNGIMNVLAQLTSVHKIPHKPCFLQIHHALEYDIQHGMEILCAHCPCIFLP